MQDGVLYIYRQAALCHLVLWNLTFHLYAFHHIGLWLESDSANMSHTDVASDSLITDIRYLQRNLLGLAGNHKVAILIADTAIHKTILEQRDIGKLNGIATVINHASDDLRVLLLGTFYIDILMVEGEVHGIESANLADSISDRYILQMGGNGKILQFIEDKVKFIMILSVVNPDQGLTERCVLEVVG